MNANKQNNSAGTVTFCVVLLALFIYSQIRADREQAEREEQLRVHLQQRAEDDKKEAAELAELRNTVFVSTRTGEKFIGGVYAIEHTGRGLGHPRRYVIARAESGDKTIRLSWGGGNEATRLPNGWGVEPRPGAEVYRVFQLPR